MLNRGRSASEIIFRHDSSGFGEDFGDFPPVKHRRFDVVSLFFKPCDYRLKKINMGGMPEVEKETFHRNRLFTILFVPTHSLS